MAQHHIPKSRLNEIALRKLGALGLTAHYTPDGETLQGRLGPEILASGPQPLVNPLSGKPLAHLQYEVEGHDRLLPIEPVPVRGLPPVAFYDVNEPVGIVARLAEQMERRADAVRNLHAVMKQKKLEADIDAERMKVVLRVDLLGSGTAIVEGDERGVFARSFQPLGKRDVIAFENLEVKIDEIDDRTDLEIFLDHEAGAALRRAESGQGSGTADESLSRVAAAPPPPAGSLLFPDLMKKFGADAVVAQGVGFTRDLLIDGKPVRFVARHRQGRVFAGRLTTSYGVAWEDTFDLDRFPGVEAFVIGVITHMTGGRRSGASGGAAGPAKAPGVPPVPPAAAPAQSADPAAPAQASGPAAQGPAAAPLPPSQGFAVGAGGLHTAEPVPGEYWVMNVSVVDHGAGEVRYQALNIDGERFGAPRVLARGAFEKVFCPTGGPTWRLLVLIQGVQGGEVVYLPLGPDRQPTSGPRQQPAAVFVSNFTPEAAAY